MCRATDGAAPVNRCTVAASATFSYGSRGTPAWAKTLKRVPELPNAQDGVSIRCRARAALTSSCSTIAVILKSVAVVREDSLLFEKTRCRSRESGVVRGKAADFLG